MTLNDLLTNKKFDLSQVLVMRHRPSEPELNKVLPWLASERHDVFNAYQQTQGEKVEKSLLKAQYVASFIRYGGDRALFVGLYKRTGQKPLTRKQFWMVPANIEMREKYKLKGFSDDEKRTSVLWFDLEPVKDFYPNWKGKLVIDWPEPAIAWCRRADKPTNLFPIHAILDDNALEGKLARWDELVLSWDLLELMPNKLKSKLSEWRGIYYIYDTFDRKGYVGSASGEENLLQRWTGYASTGHGGNKLLRSRSPKTFLFSILQRMDPDAKPSEVARLETSWKLRLHTRSPSGLNEN